MDQKALAELQAPIQELKASMERYVTEQNVLGAATKETKASMEALQKQVDAIDKKLAGNLFSDIVTPNEWKFELQADETLKRLLAVKRGNARIELDQRQGASFMKACNPRLYQIPGLNVPMDQKYNSQNQERKTVISSSAVGSATSGVLLFDRQPDITREAREELTIRDLFIAKPTVYRMVDWVKISTPVSVASPVTEGSTKPESQLTFTTVSEPVRLLAVIMRANRQVLDDFDVLMSEIQDQMRYYTKLAEEQGFLMGDGSGEDLHGIYPQAAAFDTSKLVASQGWTKIDIVRRSIQQIRRTKEVPPTFVILHPDDWADMQLTKTSFGQYLLPPGPDGVRAKRLWNLDVVETVSMTQGNFLTGSGDPAAAGIRDRMDMVIDISTEDGNNFSTNTITIRCELRTLMMVRRPNAFIKGTFTTSP